MGIYTSRDGIITDVYVYLLAVIDIKYVQFVQKNNDFWWCTFK